MLVILHFSQKNGEHVPSYIFDCFGRLTSNKSFWWSPGSKVNFLFLKISFWEYSFMMNKHNQKPTDHIIKY